MKNLAKNQAVINGLPDVTSDGYKHAYLIEEESNTVASNATSPQEKIKAQKFKQATGIPLYEFLYNPETLQMSLPINYSETTIPMTSVQPLNFSNGGNISWTIPDLYLDSYFESKSLQPLLDKLISLRNPEKQEGIRLRPKILYFKWGAARFGPCVLTNIDATITNWINGYPARARVTLSLKEVPPSDSSPANRARLTTPDALPTGNNLPKALTEKQVIDGMAQIKKYLSGPAGKLLPKTALDTLKDPKSTISINKDTGSVSLKNSKSVTILTIGVYNGDKFFPNNTFSVANPATQLLRSIGL